MSTFTISYFDNDDRLVDATLEADDAAAALGFFLDLEDDIAPDSPFTVVEGGALKKARRRRRGRSPSRGRPPSQRRRRAAADDANAAALGAQPLPDSPSAEQAAAARLRSLFESTGCDLEAEE